VLGFRRFENPVSISGRSRDLSHFHSIQTGFGAHTASSAAYNGRIQKIAVERYLVLQM